MYAHRAVLIVGALTLTAAVAGCSAAQEQSEVASIRSDGGTSSPSASPSASMNQQDALVKWATCMRQNGVAVSDPGTTTGPLIPQSGVNSQTLQRAQRACRSFLQAAGGQNSADAAASLDKFLELATCMREHGVRDFPDPVLDESGGVTFNGKIDRKAPHYQEASDACKSKLPSNGTWGGSR
ncbi:hypothetical protein AB0J35_34960 [Nonomuraea angiospora]|uniref:hypothetical protein n=1 Tax=Nonomuraea angiospora TaxID=46172 RepID=UPI0034443375